MHRRPKVRWALAVVLASVTSVVLILGIAYGAQYYARYFAEKTAEAAEAAKTMVGGGSSTHTTMPRATATPTWAVGLDDQDGLSDVIWKREEKDDDDGFERFAATYFPMDHQTTSCLEEYGCAKLYQPVSYAHRVPKP